MSWNTGNDTSLGLDQYLLVLRRQRRLVFGVIVFCLVAATAYILIAPRSVTASTSVNVNVITTDPFNQQRPASGLLDPQTEADIASSHAVAKGASQLLHGEFSAAQVRNASQVSAPGGASIVRIEFTGSTAAQAIAGADAVARAYLRFRSDQAEQRIATMLETTNDRVEVLNTDLLQANKELAAASKDSTDHAQALSQLQQIQVELDNLLSRRNALTGVDTTGGVVLTAAEENALEAHPGITRSLAVALGAGLVLGIIAGFIRNPCDRRLRSTAVISAVAEAPMIARLRGARGTPVSDQQAVEEVGVARERLLAQLAMFPSKHEVTTEPRSVLLYDARRTDSPSRAVDLLTADAEAADAGYSFEVIDSRTARSHCLAALRAVSAVILIANPRTAQTADVQWIRDETARARVPLVGWIEES